MGLRGGLQKAITGAFSAIGDLAHAPKYGNGVVYVRKSTTYDPTTGAYTGADVTVSIPVAAIVGFDLREVDNDVVKYLDCKVLFPGDVLGFDPVLTDIVQFDGKDWNIIRNMSAPDGLLNVLHVRQK